MFLDLPHLFFTYIARKAAKQEWNSKKKKKKNTIAPPQFTTMIDALGLY
jgi:hypothetical protein